MGIKFKEPKRYQRRLIGEEIEVYRYSLSIGTCDVMVAVWDIKYILGLRGAQQGRGIFKLTRGFVGFFHKFLFEQAKLKNQQMGMEKRAY